MENVLKDIKTAEEKAKRMIGDAEKKRAEAVSQAKQDSLKTLNQKKDEIDRSEGMAIEKKASELGSERQKIIEKGRKEADIIEKNAKGNAKKAEDFVLKRFEEWINS